ncbi:uncharacterized protein CDAR_481261 [Caerostris darwini]|uniref:J domain-containing protein n=1 Tax=Caerostris darwini TaxID=1538125 RepID=A0AAV4NA79_9ARAC|nr:uncharacterized protein CDAR_481261 [Caerostris darwini]
MDCYKVLRVNPGASSDEIIKAANKMLGIWNPNDYDEFRDVALCVVDDIVRARRILLDPERRKQHDEQRNVTISKLNHQNQDHTVEIASYSGLRGFYNKPWDCTSEHVTCASEDESPKYNFEAQDSSSETEPQVIIVDGSVKYISSPKHAKDNKRTDFLRFSPSTPEYEINYDVKNFGNSSSISFNSMNSVKQTGITDSQKETEPVSEVSIEAKLILISTRILPNKQAKVDLQKYLVILQKRRVILILKQNTKSN